MSLTVTRATDGDGLSGEPFSTISDDVERRELEDVFLGDHFFSLFFQLACSCDLREGSEVERCVPGRLDVEEVAEEMRVVKRTSSSSSLYGWNKEVGKRRRRREMDTEEKESMLYGCLSESAGLCVQFYSVEINLNKGGRD